MSETPKDQDEEHSAALPDRRKFLVLGSAAAAATVLSCGSLSDAAPSGQAAASATRTAGNAPQGAPRPGGRRRGKLEVSAIGMGVQNTSRKYKTAVPYRPQMINLIGAAFDCVVTHFDSAEAYGPHAVERILGDAVPPFRDQVQISSKFGWNIDQETGRRLPGTNSKPEHIKRVVDGMLRRLRTDRIDLLYQHRVDVEVPIEDVAGAVQELMQQGKVLHQGLVRNGTGHVFRAACRSGTEPGPLLQA